MFSLSLRYECNLLKERFAFLCRSVSHSADRISWMFDIISMVTTSPSSQSASSWIIIPGKETRLTALAIHGGHFGAAEAGVTQKLVDGSLVAEVLVDGLLPQRRDGAQDSDAALHLLLPPVSGI